MHTLRMMTRAISVALRLMGWALVYAGGYVWLWMQCTSKEKRSRWFAHCVLQLFRSLGATFIKVGQIMSTRPDLFSPSLIEALSQLQDNVGPFSFADVQKNITSDFHHSIDVLFQEFHQQPIASASVAQVHKARLHTGEWVAVKIRRPLVEELCQIDLAIMRVYARILNWIPSAALLAPVESLEEFAKAIRMQLDFTIEAHNNRQFQKNFSHTTEVVFPKLYDALCSRRVLTMEFIEGCKISEYNRLGANPKQLGLLGFRIMLQMVFKDGFVHADLHPGNVLITTKHQLALLDLGMVAELNQEHRAVFARYFFAWAQSDGTTMAQILLTHSPSPSCLDPQGFTKAIEEFVKKHQGKRLGEVQVVGVVFEMLQLLRKYRVRVNPTFTMVNIAIALTEGIGKQLDPSLDLLQEALPFFSSLSW